MGTKIIPLLPSSVAFELLYMWELVVERRFWKVMKGAHFDVPLPWHLGLVISSAFSSNQKSRRSNNPPFSLKDNVCSSRMNFLRAFFIAQVPLSPLYVKKVRNNCPFRPTRLRKYFLLHVAKSRVIDAHLGITLSESSAR